MHNISPLLISIPRVYFTNYILKISVSTLFFVSFRYYCMEIRTALIDTILKRFYADLAKSISPLGKTEDKAYFCEKLSELAIEMYNDPQFDEDKFLLETLYPRLKSKLATFDQSNLLLYFQTGEDQQGELLNILGITAEPLNADELQELFIYYVNTLSVIPKRLYLNNKDDNELADEMAQEKILDDAKEQLKIKMPNFNRARQTLIFYYLLKGNKVQKDTHSVAAMARFIHNSLGIPYSKIDNSEFYDKLKSAPLFKKESLLLKDLEYVKEQFLSIEAPELARLVEEDIAAVNKALKWK